MFQISTCICWAFQYRPRRDGRLAQQKMGRRANLTTDEKNYCLPARKRLLMQGDYRSFKTQKNCVENYMSTRDVRWRWNRAGDRENYQIGVCMGLCRNQRKAGALPGWLWMSWRWKLRWVRCNAPLLTTNAWCFGRWRNAHLSPAHKKCD